ncbi:hypothetical protein BLOT_000999 [Blomia tropicalis]|nr:hypothetical protein BLOT_000999 [Blomia tropicalis]
MEMFPTDLTVIGSVEANAPNLTDPIGPNGSMVHSSSFMQNNETAYIYIDNPEDMIDPFQFNQKFMTIVLTHAITFIIGVIGNSVVIVTWASRGKFRSPTATFLISLACADLLLLLIFMPLEILEYFVVTWDHDGHICKLSSFVELLSGMSSILNLVAVSVERFLVIVYPIQARRWCTVAKSRRSLIFVWLLAIIFAAPPVFNKGTTSITYYNNETSITAYYCFEKNDRWAIGFAVYELMTLFVIPAMLMVFCYFRVIRELWTSTRVITILTSSSAGQYQHTNSAATAPISNATNTKMTKENNSRSYMVRWPTKKLVSISVKCDNPSSPPPPPPPTPKSPIKCVTRDGNVSRSSVSSERPSSSSTSNHSKLNGGPNSMSIENNSKVNEIPESPIASGTMGPKSNINRTNKSKSTSNSITEPSNNNNNNHNRQSRWCFGMCSKFVSNKNMSKQQQQQQQRSNKYRLNSNRNVRNTLRRSPSSCYQCYQRNVIRSNRNTNSNTVTSSFNNMNVNSIAAANSQYNMLTTANVQHMNGANNSNGNSTNNTNNGSTVSTVIKLNSINNVGQPMSTIPIAGGGGGNGTSVSSPTQQYVPNTGYRVPVTDVRNARKQLYCQVIKMLLMIVILFLFCWGPRLIFNVFKSAGIEYFNNIAYNARVYFYLLSFIHSALNPFVYGFMSSNFRRMMMNSCNSSQRKSRNHYSGTVHNDGSTNKPVSLMNAMATTNCLNMTHLKASFSNNESSSHRHRSNSSDVYEPASSSSQPQQSRSYSHTSTAYGQRIECSIQVNAHNIESDGETSFAEIETEIQQAVNLMQKEKNAADQQQHVDNNENHNHHQSQANESNKRRFIHQIQSKVKQLDRSSSLFFSNNRFNFVDVKAKMNRNKQIDKSLRNNNGEHQNHNHIKNLNQIDLSKYNLDHSF